MLGPLNPHSPRSKQDQSAARDMAKGILEARGSAPRRYKNMLALLVPDSQRLGELTQAVKQYLAWKFIEDEAETMNLDAFQKRQAETRCRQADDTVKQRIPEAYVWLLTPVQPKGENDRPDLFAPMG